MKKTLAISLCAVMTILAACNEAETWTPDTDCTDSESRCDGNQLLVCKNATWTIENDCAADGRICGNDAEGKAVCVAPLAEPCVPSCKDGKATRCDNEGKATVDTCSETQVCGVDEKGAPACVDTAKSCMPMCANGVLTTCDAEMNKSTKSCSDDNKVCGVDENGVPACVEAVVCTFGETNVLVGTKVCDAEGKVMECQADGTMSEGTACTAGVCAEGECVRRACDDVADGKNVCKENKLMVCDDGSLVEDTENACGTDTPLCRDGEAACSAYKDCDTIEHGKNGCKDGNIVACNDGETSVLDSGNCAELSKVCVADVEAEAGYICKTPDPTDCTLNGVTVAKNETICDGNVLKTCSAEKDGVLSDGIDCASVNNGKPYCDPKLNICRDYYKCGDNDEIKHDSIACNAKGTNKAKCVDGKLVDLTDTDACSAVDNAVSVCTFDTEAVCSFACKTGYFLKNNACEEVVTCDAVKEIYNSSDNTCSCNTSANWTGTAGSCICSAGYLPIGNTCVEKKTCSDDHNILDELTNTCVCDSTNHWIGNASACQCEAGYVEISGECKAVVPCTEAHTVRGSEPNTCVCDSSKGWSGEAGSCACTEGFVNVKDICVRKVVCNANETWVEADNTCACNTEKGWTGTAGSCTCADSNKVPAGDKCEDKVTCSVGQMYVNGLNVCACDSAKGWISNGTECVCPTGYFAKDGVCTLKAVCDPYKEVYVSDDNTCACNTYAGWTGAAGSCTCDATKNLVQVGNACVEKVTCTGDGQIYVENANICACDSSKGWIGDGTTCECPSGYLANDDGVCELKAVCDPDKEVYFSDDNTCACDSDKGWTGTAGSCTCAKGTKEQSGVCVSLCTTGFDWDSVTETCVCDEANAWASDELYGGCKATAIKTMTLGHYEQDNDPATTDEPITWRILAVKDGKYLVISEKTLDTQVYNPQGKVITWENSSIRTWLNEDFLNTAFSDTEKAIIESSEVPAHKDMDYSDIDPGNATTDKVFLLSVKEAKNYFTSNADRQAIATPYAIDQGAEICYDIDCSGSSYWWLRSPGKTTSMFSTYVANIVPMGYIYSGYATYNDFLTVRPAMWVNF